MTVIAEWLAVNGAGWMESHSRQRAQARPTCPLQALDPEDLQLTMCDTLHDDETKRLLVHADEATFRLHVAFVHAHGLPRGEYTTFSNPGVICATSERVGRGRSR